MLILIFPSNRQGFFFGAKLVRGAYMNQVTQDMNELSKNVSYKTFIAGKGSSWISQLWGSHQCGLWGNQRDVPQVRSQRITWTQDNMSRCLSECMRRISLYKKAGGEMVSLLGFVRSFLLSVQSFLAVLCLTFYFLSAGKGNLASDKYTLFFYLTLTFSMTDS